METSRNNAIPHSRNSSFRNVQLLIPPRLSMDAYVDFVEGSFRFTDASRARRQKKFEKRILKPFDLGGSDDDLKIRVLTKLAE